MQVNPFDLATLVHDDGEDDAPHFDQVAALCAECAVAGLELEATLTKFEQVLDQIMPPGPGGPEVDDPDLRRRMLRIMVRALWRLLPNPQLQFATPEVPVPGRNDLCHCGSGHKYKACCQALERKLPPPIDHINLLPILLEALPRERWAELAGSRVGYDRLGDAVRRFAELEQWQEILDLLVPWFADDRALVMDNEWLLDMHVDALEGVGDLDGKARLLERAVERGDRPLRSAMLQRQASMAADQDRFDEAWGLFEKARRLDPRSPNLSHLEVVMLIAEGRESEARKQARFWVGRLERRRKPDLENLIDLLRDVARRGKDALFEADVGFGADDRQVRAALDSAPPVCCRYVLDVVDGNAGPLESRPELAEGLQAWSERITQASWLPGDQIDPEDRVNELDDMLDLLEEYPVLWDSFEALETLQTAAGELLPVDPYDLSADRLGERAWSLLECVLEENKAQDALLEWGFVENRPALNALAKAVMAQFYSESQPDLLIERLERLLRLNPSDNQGLRSVLCRVLSVAGDYPRVVALCERYPDDFAELQYQHALALFALDRKDEAAEVLRGAVESHPKVFEYLDRSRVAAPQLMPGSVIAGGDDEAFIYRSDYREDWQRLGALKWARGVLG